MPVAAAEEGLSRGISTREQRESISHPPNLFIIHHDDDNDGQDEGDDGAHDDGVGQDDDDDDAVENSPHINMIVMLR